MTTEQKVLASFGRQMMELAMVEKNDMIANALSRVGEHLAERASVDGLEPVDHKVIAYAHGKIN